MFGNNHYNVHLGLNKNVPFRSYNYDNKEMMNYHDVNIVAINDPSERATCIVVEKDGKYADFYYNGSEGNFKQLSEPGYEIIKESLEEGILDEPIGSWEYEEFGVTPQCILENGVSIDLIHELIEM